jgi:hypothetical protein
LWENFGEGGDQIGVTFEAENARNFADDKMAGVEAKLLAEREIVRGVGEGLEIEPAENAREHCRLADACGEIQFCHRASGTEKMVSDFSRVTFGGGENEVSERTLKISK